MTRATSSAKNGQRQSIARVAGVHPGTITRWAREGRIPPAVAVRLPSGRWRYDLDAAADWLAEILNRKQAAQ
ncbi:MAG TPA: helix-turn-helix domain-containing protein [Acidimicrobiales bacterium]|nr:helix-turn-helix domain-containing protein [Acidimicrobiales bacterium]